MSDDEVPMPEVKSYCGVCRVEVRDVEDGKCIVSPDGKAHYTNGFESTACGHDATGSGWWWPL